MFGWETLCPVLFADPIGLLVVMPRAQQPVTEAEVDALPDYYPDVTSEVKVEDHGRIDGRILALDYGYPDRRMVHERRAYYARMSNEFAGRAGDG